MKLTYMLSPTGPYVMHTQTSNILSDNLLKDTRIEPIFNISIINVNMDMMNERDALIEKMGDSPLETFLKKSSPNYFKILGAVYSYRTGFFEKVLSTIKTDIVLMTCWNIYSIPFIKFLLKNGKRLMIGGCFANAYPTAFIRTQLKELGVTDNELKNFTVIKGYVGTDTDLHKVILDWNDIELPEYDFIDMWTAKNDHIKKYLKIVSRSRRSDNTYYSITFNNNCWYNKCKFCKLRDKKEPNFICDVSVDELYENIIENLKLYKHTKLIINDNYFMFNDKNKEVFKRIRKAGYKIYILSGIISFNSKSYLKDFNEYVDEVGLGLEAATDFSLDYIHKGYTWDDIKRSVDNMSKYLDRDKNIRYLIISDLIFKDQKDIIQNYQNIATIKEMLNGHGFNQVAFSMTPLQLFPSVEMVKETDFLKVTKSPTPSGMWYIYNYFKSLGIEINVPPEIMMPFERYDINGKLLLSDFEYIDKNLMDQIF